MEKKKFHVTAPLTIIALVVIIVVGVFLTYAIYQSQQVKKLDYQNKQLPKSQIASNVGKINITISEKSTENFDGRHIIIRLSTKEQYSCSNIQLDVNTSIKEKIISFDILGMKEASICTTALGPASFVYDLGNISGEYKLSINNLDNKDLLDLSVNDETIKISKVVSSFADIEKKIILRFPKGTIKVDCTRKTKETRENMCNQFNQDLENIGARRSNKDYAKLLNSGVFLYEYDGEETKLKDLINNYRQYDQMLIEIYTWRGQKYLSWINN